MCLEIADQLQLDVMRLAVEGQANPLSIRARHARDEAEIGRAIRTVGDDFMTPAANEREEARVFRAVGIEDGGPARRQQRREEPVLGGAVRAHVAVVVEVIAGEVGEGSGGERQAVKAELGEAVARRLDRDAIDAAHRQFAQGAVQRHRVGRGQRAGMALAADDAAERAEAGRCVAQRLPDLAGKMRDRGLAVGAGDRGKGLGPHGVEAGRRKRQQALRVGVGDNGDPALAALHRDRAPPDRRSGSPPRPSPPPRAAKRRPSVRAPLQRRKQETRPAPLGNRR